MSVPGVGQAKANAIVEYRNQQGAFQEIDDLKKVKGFGSKTFDNLLIHDICIILFANFIFCD